jgi:hypothetical protein
MGTRGHSLGETTRSVPNPLRRFMASMSRLKLEALELLIGSRKPTITVFNFELSMKRSPQCCAASKTKTGSHAGHDHRDTSKGTLQDESKPGFRRFGQYSELLKRSSFHWLSRGKKCAASNHAGPRHFVQTIEISS